MAASEHWQQVGFVNLVVVFCSTSKATFEHSIIEWFAMEGTLKII